MKALIIGSSNLEFNGGGERNGSQVAEILSNIGFDVTYMGSGAPFERKSNIKPNFNYIKDAFYFDLFSNSKIMKMSDGASMGLIGLLSFKKIWNMIKGYDLYYFVTPDIIFSKAIKNFKKYDCDPVIILANHGSYFEILKSKNTLLGTLIKMVMDTIILRKAIGRITIQAQNLFQEDYYKSFGFNDILTIPQNNVSFDNYYYEYSSEFHVVFLNKITKNKGSKMLFDIIDNNKNKNIFFDIIGYGNIDYLNKKYSNKNAKFYGFLNENEKKRMLAGSDVAINCSLYESLSISSIEGLASGLIVIAPDISGIDYLKKITPEGIKIVNYNYKDYLNAIYSVYNSKRNIDSYMELKKCIKEDAKNVLDEKIISNGLERIINKSLKYYNDSNVTMIISFKSINNINEKLKHLIYFIQNQNININEIIIINNTLKNINIENFNFDVRVIENKNESRGSLEIMASLAAKNDIVMVTNDSIPVSNIYKLIYEKRNGYDVVIGSRYIHSKIRIYRDFFNKAAAFITSILLPSVGNINDPLSDFYIFDRKILQGLHSYKNVYKSLIYLIAFSRTRKYHEVQISLDENELTSSEYLKYSLFYSKELIICYKEYHKNFYY